MIDSLRKAVWLPDISVQVLLSAGVVVGFVWLVAQNGVHPIMIYLLQLYLSL
jgi:hypothetical protein